MDNNLEQLYREFEKLSMKHEPLASAGIMMAQALKIYKAMLSEEEFLAGYTNLLNTGVITIPTTPTPPTPTPPTRRT